VIASIRLGFFLLLFTSVGTAQPRDERKEQEEALDAIRRLGGKVYYDYQRPNPDIPTRFQPEAKPKNASGFHRVVLVGLGETKVTDDDLKILGKLPNLENLDLSKTRITSAGLAHLRGLKNLRVLSLWKTQVDDAGLEHLEGLTKLWQLSIDETRITDAGVAHLKGLTSLEEWLGLADTRITDDGVKYLTALTKLRHLNLRRTQVTPAGVATLKGVLLNTEISFGP